MTDADRALQYIDDHLLDRTQGPWTDYVLIVRAMELCGDDRLDPVLVGVRLAQHLGDLGMLDKPLDGYGMTLITGLCAKVASRALPADDVAEALHDRLLQRGYLRPDSDPISTGS